MFSLFITTNNYVNISVDFTITVVITLEKDNNNEITIISRNMVYYKHKNV